MKYYTNIPKYNHRELEAKWQQNWRDTKLFQTEETSHKPKFYALDMFPYPSGVGLHVGHPKGYIATDILSRFKHLSGYEVLHPMGWDAFGLPAENYAIKHKVHPRQATEANVATYKSQIEKIGFTYDWSREINTTDPQYYKWTQWAFAEMFKRGLVMESHEPINWCPTCLTGLANEDLEDGKCERCGTVVEKKPLRQWVIKITDYAERLLADLDTLTDWDDNAKEMQRNWIGKSEGAVVKFPISNFQFSNKSQAPMTNDSNESIILRQSEAEAKNLDEKSLEPVSPEIIEVFTTRPDTIFGATYLVICPEHSAISNFQFSISNWEEVQAYINQVKNKSDLERTDLNKDKTGVELKGIKALNPVNNQEIPIYVADYVLAGYGTGAIMAVPAHDERDFEFATKYNLPIVKVVTGDGECFIGSGQAINSGFINGLNTDEAKRSMINWLEKNNLGSTKVNYKLKDWVFSRQRYWGEPMPLIFCSDCKKSMEAQISNFKFQNEGERLNPGWFVDDRLPVTLPEVDSYEPSGTGESPLANISDWVNIKCPRCGGDARRETNTMPQWAGSSWYYLRYMDPHNSDALVASDKMKYWGEVDCYVGGAEHVTRHMIYARFWHKFLFDLGVVNYSEPFAKYRSVGLVMGEDGRKMSKRWGNVINPDDIIVSHGADALRVYEMFMGPFSQSVAWSTNGLIGARKFLDKVYLLSEKLSTESDDRELERLLHKTIKKVADDIENFNFNTAVSAMMILTNAWTSAKSVNQDNFKKFLIILSPFAPHLTEELWHLLGETASIYQAAWPQYNSDLARDEKIELVVQVNGKLRDTLEVAVDLDEESAITLAKSSEKIIKWLDGHEIVKIVFVKNKLINIVTKAK